MKKKLSQSALAARCQIIGYNISREGLAKIESRLRGVGDFEMAGIAHVLDIELSDLFPKNTLNKAKECFLD